MKTDRIIRAAPGQRRFGSSVVWALVLAALFLGNLAALADKTPSPKNSRAANLAEQTYADLQARWQKNPTNAELAWQFGRGCFDAAEFAGHDSYRAHLAEKGIEACRQAIALEPRLGAAHYYLALNMGQKARSDKLGALKLVRDMEAELKQALGLDAKLDYGGPDRSLGLLYRDAPGWPMSIGSRRKARVHLIKATQIAAEFPENWLSLLEAYLRWGETDKVQELLPVVEGKIGAARQQFAGLEWEWSWQDWERRWEKIRLKMNYKVSESAGTEGK